MIVMLSWMRDLPAALYPDAPPQYRSGVSQLPNDPLAELFRDTNALLITLFRTTHQCRHWSTVHTIHQRISPPLSEPGFRLLVAKF
jgi:hypothetical protein